MSRTKRRAGTTGTSTTRDDQSSRASSCFHFYQAGPSTGRRRAGTTDEPGRPTSRDDRRTGPLPGGGVQGEPSYQSSRDNRRPTTTDEPALYEPGRRPTTSRGLRPTSRALCRFETEILEIIQHTNLSGAGTTDEQGL